jgi:catechol 2,3-dioxygenase-like lactoylglutathione lyase family enzyme
MAIDQDTAAPVGAGKIVGVNHFSLTVEDLDRSLAFWRDTLGLEQIEFAMTTTGDFVEDIVGLSDTFMESVFVRAPGILIEIIKYVTPEGTPIRPRTCDPGCTHIAFECENLEAIFERVRANGYTTRADRVIAVPEGDWAGTKTFYSVDPDGVTVELLENPSA